MKLISNAAEVEKLLNNAPERFLSVALNYDGYHSVSPMILQNGDENTLLVRHIEVGNVRAMQEIEKSLPLNYEVSYYNTYLTFEKQQEKTYIRFIDAFSAAAAGEREVEVQPDLPLSVYTALRGSFYVQATAMPAALKYVYVLKRETVKDIFASGRREANAIAARLIRKSPVAEDLIRIMQEAVDQRFELSDEIMAESGVDAWLLTSPLGVQEQTGFGIEKHVDYNTAALYLKDGAEVFLICASPVEGLGPAQMVQGLGDFLKSKASGMTVGVEEQHFPVGWLREVEASVGKVVCGMHGIRLLREHRGSEDLGFFIIAARASVYATEGSLAWAQQKIIAGESVSELDVFDEYKRLLQEFKARSEIPFDIVLFWTNCHASSRSVIPSLPNNYKLNLDSGAIKIDAGVSIRCKKGIHHAASDIARTILFNKNTQAIYDKFDDFMVKEVIPNIKAGMSPEDIYHLTVGCIENEREFFEKQGLIPFEPLTKVFKRDVGHTMGLQEPVELFFKPGDKTPLRKGTVGALEYQWSKNNYGIGVEDLFVIDDGCSYNFSRDKL